MSIPIRKIEPRFLDMVNYGVCSTLSKLYGVEATEKVFRLAGETNFRELKKRCNIDSSSPIATLRSVASYLEESGYMNKIELTKVTETEVVIDMYGVSVTESSMRLVEENMAPSHFMTNMMFAALKDLHGVEAEIIDLNFETPEEEIDHVREKWVLRDVA